MAADNNLSSAAIRDLNEMEQVGSTDQVKVVVQLDTLTDPARRYLIQKDNDPFRFTSPVLTELGEIDMANQNSLKDFVTWGLTTYPADHTVLILWDHGGDGWSKPGIGSRQKILHSVLVDDTSAPNRFLSNRLAGQAIKEAEQKTGRLLDLLGLDASRMGSVETAFEFKDLAPLLVFSQEIGQDNGWDYAAILSALTQDTGQTPEALAQTIVQSYRTFYETVFYPTHPGFEHFLTISAIRLGPAIQAIADQANTWADAWLGMLNNPSTRQTAVQELTAARKAAQPIDKFVIPYTFVDLYDLASRLDGSVPAAPLQSAITKATVAEYHGSARPGAHGLSVVFFQLPESVCTAPTFDPNYTTFDPDTGKGSRIAWIAGTEWDELLNRYASVGFPSLFATPPLCP